MEIEWRESPFTYREEKILAFTGTVIELNKLREYFKEKDIDYGEFPEGVALYF